MKKKAFKIAGLLTLVLAFFAISTVSNGQSKSDVCDGKFSLPSYTEKYGGWADMNSKGIDGHCFYKFSDGTEGELSYSKDCNKYCIKSSGVAYKYKDLETALKALYAQKKYYCIMDGGVNCN